MGRSQDLPYTLPIFDASAGALCSLVLTGAQKIPCMKSTEISLAGHTAGRGRMDMYLEGQPK